MDLSKFRDWRISFRYLEVKGLILSLIFQFEIENIWFFQCKIEFYFTKWTPDVLFSQVARASSENTSFGVHEWNKIGSYTEKIKLSVSFMLLFTIN